ncbi:hypothetical protein [Aliterella atlantica]|uniref:Restriction endonuclease subunit S n=1 Tax=Aliterella atlantica CENA595 TaxID=1618023 RepID=A0A0D8ZRU5_9CYAN|nr:hypothetical protein [Aliterella atlantica]KJH69926.1 hypothetical protein UH38_21085 [Aliterella atlantica CENA595]
MTIPPEILSLVEQLNQQLDSIDEQANEGLAIAIQLLERFPNNARLIGLSANLGNILFFVYSFRNRIEGITERISGITASNNAIREAGEELSEIWGRVLECKIIVDRSVVVLKDLQ